MSQNWLLLIPVGCLVLFAIGPFAVLRMQKKASAPRGELRSAAPTGLQQASQESREEFVRRHWQRSGVVANGVTLVDLYDRIRALEERVTRAEQNSTPPPTD